jgi:hypothetical protein
MQGTGRRRHHAGRRRHGQRLHAQPGHRPRNDHPISVTFNARWPRATANCAGGRAAALAAGSGSVLGVRAPGVQAAAAAGAHRHRGGRARCSAPAATTRTCASSTQPRATRSSCARSASRKPARLPRTTRPATSSAWAATTRTAASASGPTRHMPARSWPTRPTATRSGHAARVSGRPAGVEGSLPELPRHAHGAGRAPPHARRHRRRAARRQPAGARQGGNPALENTCYQCHTSAARSALASVTQVPDIETPFGRRRSACPSPRPTRAAHRGGARHLGQLQRRGVDCAGANNRCGADGMEPRPAGAAPRRVHRLPQPAPRDPQPAVQRRPRRPRRRRHAPPRRDHRLHAHQHRQSGVLRGAWGVEPVYGSTSFQSLPERLHRQARRPRRQHQHRGVRSPT